MTTTGLLIILILALFSAMAFWKENAIMFMILFAVAFPIGFFIPDIISGEDTTTGIDIALALGIVMYGVLCGGWSLKLLLKNEVDQYE